MLAWGWVVKVRLVRARFIRMRLARVRLWSWFMVMINLVIHSDS